MAANLANVPDEIKRLFLEGIEDFLWQETELRARIRDPAARIEGAPLFTLGIEDILSGAGAGAAQPAGWRLFVETDLGTVAGDVTRPYTGNEVLLRSVNRAAEAVETLQAIRALCRRPGIESVPDFELRLLRIPGIATEFCWFRSPLPDKDVFSPVISGAPQFHILSELSPPEFMAAAKETALQFRRFDELPH